MVVAVVVFIGRVAVDGGAAVVTAAAVAESSLGTSGSPRADERESATRLPRASDVLRTWASLPARATLAVLLLYLPNERRRGREGALPMPVRRGLRRALGVLSSPAFSLLDEMRPRTGIWCGVSRLAGR